MSPLPRLLVLALAVIAAAPARAELRVVATTTPLAALAREIGGTHVEVTALALPTQDPHFVDARPSLALELARADLLLVNGLGLEVGWLPTLQVGARNPAIQTGARGYLDCSSLARVLEVPTGPIDRSAGDIHPGGNPHYLYDPREAVRVVAGIAERMASLDAARSRDYRQGAARLSASLTQAIARWTQALAPARGAAVLAYHRSFPYLAAFAGLTIVDHVEPRPGIPPNPGHVAQVLATGRVRGARFVLQEVYYPTSTSRLVAERLGAPLVLVPGGPNLRARETYETFVDGIVRALTVRR